MSGVVRWHSFDRATFDIGRTTVSVDDTTTIGLYDAPRTIVDTYRLRHTAGSEVAHEALRGWLRGGGQPAQLIAVARAFPRAMPALLNAFEVLPVRVGRTPPPTRATIGGRAYLDLRAMARKSGRANDEYLRLYALEGFLLRLAASASGQDFVLKGGVLLAAYQLRHPRRGRIQRRAHQPWG